MVATKTERRAFLWTILPRPVPKESAAFVTIDEIIDALVVARDKGTANYQISEREGDEAIPDTDPKNRVYIADIQDNRGDGYVTVLVNRGDPIAADPAFIDSTDNSVISVRPEGDQVQGWSAHLVIRTNNPYPDGRYRACFEQMQHASGSLALSLFRGIFTRHARGDARYRYVKRIKLPKGKFRTETKEYRPELSVQKRPSANLLDDLSRGELSEIILTNTTEEFSGPGATEFVKSSVSTLKLKPNQTEPGAISRFLEKLRPWAIDKGFNGIQFKLRNLPGASSSPDYS